MTALRALIAREIRSHLVSPVAWLALALFLLLSGYFFFNLVSQFSVLLSNYTIYAQINQSPELLERVNLNEVVVAGLFRSMATLFLFMIPVLTMRSFSEERRLGTDELLLTAPVSPGKIVAGKFLGVLFVVLTMVLAGGYLILLLLRYGDPETGPIWSGLLGLALVAAALSALGMAVSFLTRSQVLSAVSSFVLFLVLFVVDWPARTLDGWRATALRQLSLPAHLEKLNEGLIASGDVAYFLSLTALGLFVARAALVSQRWR